MKRIDTTYEFDGLLVRYGSHSIPLFLVRNKEIIDQLTGIQSMAQLEDRTNTFLHYERGKG